MAVLNALRRRPVSVIAIALTVAVGSWLLVERGNSTGQQAIGEWSTSGNLYLPRAAHTATLIGDDVLLVGGIDADFVHLASEVFSPESGRSDPIVDAEDVNARVQHTATRLPGGGVLLTGGNGGFTDINSSAVIFTRTGGSSRFDETGRMVDARWAHTATLLEDGRVLIFGGFGEGDAFPNPEIYDPLSGTFASTTSTSPARVLHEATRLEDGRVLLTGGTPLLSAALFNPATNQFSTTGAMLRERYHHTATLLDDGTVLLVGGQIEQSSTCCVAVAERYDPATATFSAAGTLSTPRAWHTATLLGDGRVLMSAGGWLSRWLAS